MEPWLLNWTSFVVRNTQTEFEGLTYGDGPEWFDKMWESWLKNSDLGRKLKQEKYELVINEAYDRYTSLFLGYEDVPTKEVFMFLCKTDKDFSERWGLDMKEVDLVLEEKFKNIKNKER